MGSVRLSCAVAASVVALGAVVAAAAPASARQASPVPAARQTSPLLAARQTSPFLAAQHDGPVLVARPQAKTLPAARTPAAMRAGVRAVPAVPKSARELGELPAATSLHLLVTLKVRNPAALTSFISAVSDRMSPLFHHFLRPGQFGAKFGATPLAVSRVDAALRSVGLVPGRVSSNRLSIPVHASATAAEHAFGTTLTRYRLANGRLAYANSVAARIPPAAAPYVTGVLGLSTVDVPHSLAIRPTAPRQRLRAATRARLRPAAAGPRPCGAASATADIFGSFTADHLASYYGMSPLYGLGDLGQGVHVALAEFEDNSTSDITAYLSCYGISPSIDYVTVDGGPAVGAGSGEAALDIEDVAGLAPDVTIDVYQAPNGGDTNTYDMYNAIISADADQVVSTSWGECELDEGSTLIADEQSLFEQAATQGQTVLAAAGDDGSTDCGNGDLAVDDPGSQPYVVSVGGTSIQNSGESVWNDSATSDGAGGGGASAAWCMPAYQDQTAIPGLINTYSQPVSCSSGPQYARQVPDVSADADPETGYTIYYGGSWMAFGGTSAAAPLWAAVAALTDASPFCRDYQSGTAGVQPAGLYAVAAGAESYIYDSGEALTDVTSGDNDYTPDGYSGGLYPATTGYDMTSGLGTPLASGYRPSGVSSTWYPGLTALMCFVYGSKSATTASISRIGPNVGALKGGNTVTVTGKGFLPIAGADEAAVGKKIVPVTCTSSTRCTIKMPREGTGTVNIQIAVEDGLEVTALTKHDHYEYAAAAHISSLSPRSGSAGGGNRVTIRGTNFLGILTVHFGRRTARIVSHSPTKLVVVAPRGSGTVTVIVSAGGGSSAPSRYRYQ
jgi:subtilase family serine protease